MADVADINQNSDKPKKHNSGYWTGELNQARKRVRNWHKQADKIVNRYIDRTRDDDRRLTDKSNTGFSINLFHSNVTTLNSIRPAPDRVRRP